MNFNSSNSRLSVFSPFQKRWIKEVCSRVKRIEQERNRSKWKIPSTVRNRDARCRCHFRAVISASLVRVSPLDYCFNNTLSNRQNLPSKHSTSRCNVELLRSECTRVIKSKIRVEKFNRFSTLHDSEVPTHKKKENQAKQKQKIPSSPSQSNRQKTPTDFISFIV